jgi:hypothetical protein
MQDQMEGASVKYMLIHCGDQTKALTAEERATDERLLTAWLKEYEESGVILHGDRLSRVETATTVRLSDGELLIADGPFAETKEQIGGYDVIECADLDEAIEVASKHPTALWGTIEIRPFMTS